MRTVDNRPPTVAFDGTAGRRYTGLAQARSAGTSRPVSGPARRPREEIHERRLGKLVSGNHAQLGKYLSADNVASTAPADGSTPGGSHDSHPRPCGCRKPCPARSSGMFVLVKESAEASGARHDLVDAAADRATFSHRQSAPRSRGALTPGTRHPDPVTCDAAAARCVTQPTRMGRK
jgi:hypothetical protein